MPYRPETDLKRPDLKGEFICGHCGRTFCHAASLNRHRLDSHRDNQHCQICDKQIDPIDTVRRHMRMNHGIERVYTCGCCNWTFPDKKVLQVHIDSISKTGQPGEAKAIATSNIAPGSLSQNKLRGGKRAQTDIEVQAKIADSPEIATPPTIEETQEVPAPATNVNPFDTNLGMMMPGTIDWISMYMNNPAAFLPFLQQVADFNETNNIEEEDKENVYIDVETISDDEDEHVPPASSPFNVVNLLATGQRKRKTVDDIASQLIKKTCLKN